MENNPNFYPPQQNWNEPPLPPEKNNTGWIKWVIIGLAVAGLLTWLIISVASFGKKFGHTINDISGNKISVADSLQAISLQMDYDSVYAMLAHDSTDTMKFFIDDLKNSSDSVINVLNTLQEGFNDSIQNTSGLQKFTAEPAYKYFIKTGRATKLKNTLISYRDTRFHYLPPFEQDSFLLSYITIAEMDRNAPAFLKKLAAWESINFNQPVMTVNINFRTLKSSVRNFEQAMLEHYEKIISTAQNSGLIIIGPNGDTVK